MKKPPVWDIGVYLNPIKEDFIKRHINLQQEKILGFKLIY